MAAKKSNSKTVEVDADTLRRLQNTVLLNNRVHFGRTTGRGLGQFGGNFIAAITDPITGLSELFGFVEGLGGGLREGVQTSRLIFVDAKSKTHGKSVEKLQAQLKKAKARAKKSSENFMSAEELAEVEPDLEAALASGG
jgi:hypothetical protein